MVSCSTYASNKYIFSHLAVATKIIKLFWFLSEVVFEKAYCEYRLNRVESALKTIEGATEQTDKLKELYGQVVRPSDHEGNCIITAWFWFVKMFSRASHKNTLCPYHLWDCNVWRYSSADWSRLVFASSSCTGWSATMTASPSTQIWSGTPRMSTKRRGKPTLLLWWLLWVSGRTLHW